MANTSNKKSTGNGNRSTAPKAQSANQAPKGKKVPVKKEPINRQKLAIILAGVGALLSFLVLIEGESGWTVCHDFMFRLFGYCAYLVALTVIYIAIICAKDNPDTSLASKVICAVGLNVFACMVMHIFAKSNTVDYFTNTSIADQILDVWESKKIGGILGAILGGAVTKVVGKTGAGIISMILLIVFILLVTGLTLPLIFTYVKKPGKKIAQVTSEKFEENSRRREQAKIQREIEEEERKNRKPPELPTNANEPVKKQRENLIPKDPVIPNSKPANVNVAVTDEKTVTKIDEKPVSVPSRKKTKTETVKQEERANEDKFEAPSQQDKPIGDYVFPSIECLTKYEVSGLGNSQEELTNGANQLIETLQSFNISAQVTNICRGPSVTRYELMPAAGVRISKITTLEKDIALRMAAQSIRMEAPIPGKSAIGIEVPNSNKSMVSMREIVDTETYKIASAKSKLNVALGKDITGNLIFADLAKMPHLLVAGTTGSGKSVCLNTMIISLLYNASPDEVKLLMIDPKQVEFTIYNGIAHLAVPVVSNPRKAAAALSWAVSEMDKRYAQFSENGVRDIKGFNKLAGSREGLMKMHHIVIFIDELSDLMMASPKEVEDSICRLAQMARAAGIHLVIATQRPSVDVITGLIKANIPSRIALFVSSQTDSRTIIDQGGAEKLLGNGDMLFNPVGASKPTRVQGCYISDEEVNAIVEHIKKHSNPEYDDTIIQEIDAKAAQADGGKKSNDDDSNSDLDPMFNDAAEVVIMAGQASTTMLQKKLKLGYARASRVMDELEENGIVGPSEGAKPRQVLISKQEWYERQALSTSTSSGKKDEQLSFESINSYNNSSIDLDEEVEDAIEDDFDEEIDKEYEEYEEEFDEDYEETEEENYEENEEPEEIEVDFIPEVEYVKDEYADDYYEEEEPVEVENFYEEEYEEDNPIDVDYIFMEEEDEVDEDIDEYLN